MPNIIEITDFNAPELDIYARLTEAQLLNSYELTLVHTVASNISDNANTPSSKVYKNGMFIAESPKVIERALDAGCIPVSLLLEKKHIEGEAKDIVARCKNIPIYTAEFNVLTELTGFKLTRGALCAMYRPTLPSVNEVCMNARRIAVLENVMNPTNVGAIFRSAAALNIDAILLTTACSNPLYRRAIRVSMGTVFQIPWTFMPSDTHNISETHEHNSYVTLLKHMGFKTVAMALNDDALDIDDPKLMAEGKLAIILGTEGDGLADSTIDECDYTVCIPMSHGVDSLNVAAASAVAFWQLGNR